LRLDLWLVQNKLAVSRTQAQELIKKGFVFLKKKDHSIELKKSNYDVNEVESSLIFIKDNNLQKFVSRGGLKLEAALAHVKLNVTNQIVLDVGQSTGGFTDCLLQKGAQKVVGFDVGQDQLHESLRQNEKVIFFESQHVNEIQQNQKFMQIKPSLGFDLIVADVSFISLTKVMLHLQPLLKKAGRFLFLVKPQFEAGPDALDKNGIVKDEKYYAVVQNNVCEEAEKVFGHVEDYFKSDLQGKDGNQEFFIYGENEN
jgi:23S rRNA (cytidine1920-2'-O)/16S rRNA (cytidine1409-2'-O)-methyltransferase